MIDLVNKAKGIKPVVFTKTETKLTPINFTKSTLRLLKAVRDYPWSGAKEIKVLAKTSQGHTCTILLSFVKAGLVTRKGALVNGRDGFVYKISESFLDVDKVIEGEKKKQVSFTMSKVDKEVYSIISNMEICRASHIASKMDICASYAGVYIRRLIKAGMVNRVNLPHLAGNSCAYVTNNKVAV